MVVLWIAGPLSRRTPSLCAAREREREGERERRKVPRTNVARFIDVWITHLQT